MRVIGLTGGIACGKSTVSSSLRGMGLCVIDGDELSRRLTAPGGAALPAIREAFGPEVFLPDGQLNRRELGRRVFGHPEALAALDTLMEPPLFELIHAELAAARARGEALAVLDMPFSMRRAGPPLRHGLVRLRARGGADPASGRARRLLPGGGARPHPQPDAHGGEGCPGGSGD